jgi:hypothetical protein
MPRRRAIAIDRTSLALGVVFVFAGAFYFWTAASSLAVIFDEGGLDRYNLLASAFLHLHLALAHAPAALLALSEPYNPAQNSSIVGAQGLHDEVLYGGQTYLLWGPVPALLFLAPLHLLGLEPSGSVTVPFFAIVGLGFALGTLRLIVRAVGGIPLWMSLLAACAVALCSAMPFLLRTPSETEDAISAGFCFAMAGIWFTAAALVAGRSSLLRLSLASLCFGLAAGSRQTLVLVAVVLVPLYLSLRRTRTSRDRRRLAAALCLPVGLCVLALLLYNQARFDSPLEFGFGHQLAGYDPLTVRLRSLSYVLPNTWYYLLSPPRPLVLFPFVGLTPPPLSYPLAAPAGYREVDITGGILPMMPIALFLPALPWIWRRRPAWLGALGAPLSTLSGVGVVLLLLLGYIADGATERYEVDFAMLLLLGSLTAWFALSHHVRPRRRRPVRILGGVLVVWSCLMGLAVSFVGYGNFLAVHQPGTWNALQDAGSPLSTLIAAVAGGPVLAEVQTPHVLESLPARYTTLSGGIEKEFWLARGQNATFVVASPGRRTVTLAMKIVPGIVNTETSRLRYGIGSGGVALQSGAHGPLDYAVPARGLQLRIALPVHAGVNRFELAPIAHALALPDLSHPELLTALLVSGVSLDGHV